MTPEPSTEAGRRVAAFLRDLWRRHANGRVQEILDCSESTADRVLAGRVSPENMQKLLEWGGWRFAHFVLEPICGPLPDGDSQTFLDRIDHDARTCIPAALAEIGRVGDRVGGGWDRRGPALAGTSDEAAWAAGGIDRRQAADRRRLAGPAWIRNVIEQADRSVQELRALCGSVDLVEDMPIHAAASHHAAILRLAEESGGFLTEAVVGYLAGAGLDPMVSVFEATDQLPLLMMGSGTKFWSNEQRAKMVGGPWERVPAPAPFKRMVAQQLGEVRSTGRATIRRIVATCGGLQADYQTLRALDRASNSIIAIPLLGVPA